MTPQDLEKLRAGIALRCVAYVRGVAFTFRALTIAEQLKITSTTLSRIEALKPHERHSQNESAINAKLTLQEASNLDPVNWSPQVLESTFDLLTPDELGYLFAEYQQFLTSCNPTIEQIPLETIKDLVEEVKKNPARAIELSSLQLINLVRYLVTSSDSLPDK